MSLAKPWSWLRSAEHLWLALPSSGRFGLTCLSVAAPLAFFFVGGGPGSLARKSMRLLLFYRGWMYRDSGQLGGVKTSSKMQLRKRMYLASLRVLWHAIESERWLLGRGKRGLLYAVQDTLPQLPLPKLRDTCQRFLASLRPVLRSEEYEHLANLVSELASRGGSGEALQAGVERKAGACQGQQSWVEEAWEDELLARRDPLPVNSNWYGLDRLDTPTSSQARRAALLISGALRFQRHIAVEKLQPLRIMDVVPLCMHQYRRMFFTSRIPGRARDSLETRAPTGRTVPHVAVMCKGQTFAFDVCHANGQHLSVDELEYQVQTS